MCRTRYGLNRARDPASLRGVLLPDVGSDLGNNFVVRQRLCLRRRTRVPECGTDASVGGVAAASM